MIGCHSHVVRLVRIEGGHLRPPQLQSPAVAVSVHSACGEKFVNLHKGDSFPRPGPARAKDRFYSEAVATRSRAAGVGLHHRQKISAVGGVPTRIEDQALEAQFLQTTDGLGQRLGFPDHPGCRVLGEDRVEVEPGTLTRSLIRLPVDRTRVETEARDQVLIDRVGKKKRIACDPFGGLQEPRIQCSEIGLEGARAS